MIIIGAGNFSGAHCVTVDKRLACEHSRRKLSRRHFKRKNAYGFLRFLCDVRCDIHGKRRFTHAGSRADYNHISRRQPDYRSVKVGIAGFYSRCRLRVCSDLIKLVERLDKRFLYRNEFLCVRRSGKIENFLLCVVKNVFDLAPCGIGVFRYLLGSVDKRAENGFVVNDAGIILYVCRRRHNRRDNADVSFTFVRRINAALGKHINKRD